MTNRRPLAVIFNLVLCLLLSGQYAAGQEANSSGFRIRPSDVAVPPAVPLGEYQRMIRPFENWILISDENLKARQRVCNVTQTIENQAGQIAFSWSLAATPEGKPYMILRTAPVARSDGSVSLKFKDRMEPVEVRTRWMQRSRVCRDAADRSDHARADLEGRRTNGVLCDKRREDRQRDRNSQGPFHGRQGNQLTGAF